MVKSAIQPSRPGTTVGIEFDHLAIRAALLTADGKGGVSIERLEEARGDFEEDSGLLEGLRQIKNALGISGRDGVVACMAGKQVFASQIAFRKLPLEELEPALRLELRKTVHFEVATSALDYEILSEGDEKDGGQYQLLVALAANSLLNRRLKALERAGLRATAVDVLPVAVANALRAWNAGSGKDHPLIALHVGPQVSTIVIDGTTSPFFNRNVRFAASDATGESPREKDASLKSLADEVSRSLIFYEKNFHATGFRELLLLGDYLDDPSLAAKLRAGVELPVRVMDLPVKMGWSREAPPGRFDLAVALALRGEA